MEFASSILSSILSKIGEYLVDSSLHQANYLLRFKNIVEDLKKEEGNLRLIHDRVQHEVERAKRNTEEIEKDVEKWLMDVQNVLEEIQRLEDDIQVKKTFLCGQCTNWRWRCKVSRRAVGKRNEMAKLRESGNFSRVSHSTTLPGVEGPKDFISFKPTEYAFSRIMEALKNDKINMIGLYGMGGVGKTTLAKVVGKEAEEKKLFDKVVMVTVTQSPDVKKIQTGIAGLLGLKFEDEETIELRAQRLCKRLKNEKKTLLILDDVWEKLDLTTIGIPFGDDHKGCTILLTTRRQEVCKNMRCQPRIQLDILNEDEALTLFKKHAGIYNINDFPTLDDMVKEVVGECRGLPIAVVTIGSALREKTIDDWKDVSKKLKMSKFTDIEIVDQNVYACLKLSYDFLKAEETKFCFLLCSLFPEDYEINLEELLRYALGLVLYRDADSIEEARSQLRVTINNLKSSCLLLDAKEGFVKMHDLVRDVALWITSKGENVFMVKAGMRLKEWPKHQGVEQCTAISLMGNDLEVLLDGLVCPKLKILLLEGNNVEVSDEFFEEMKTLKVASLSWIDLSVKSLQFLTNLMTLQLIHCRLSDISSIKKLAKLEILSLKGSEIVELPEELGELNKLRMLDITDCGNLKRIHVNVIPRLSRLEELYIGSYNCFKAWEVEGTSVEQSNASLSELSKLYCLTILSLCINVQPLLPKDFVLPTKLLRYCVTVNYEYMEESYPKSRILKIRGIEATSLVAFKALYENVEYLELGEIKGCCQNMVPSIYETGLNELKSLSLWSFDELECIIDTTQQQDVAFSNLVDLSLDSVGLREICSGGRPPRGFLENLETLDISNCGSMSSLFPSWVLIQRLRKLKKVTVYECGELEDVFQLEGLSYAKENPFLLSSLESLHLVFLLNLRYIWKGPTQQVSLQSLTVVNVYSCNKLRYLFTLSLARSLLQLEELKVYECDSLEHIVEIEEAEENVDGGGGNDVMFPKLRILQLGVLYNFINFYSENSSLNMQTAKEQLQDVNLLRHGLQNLEELMIGWCRVQVLFQLEGVEQELSFPSLKVLELKYLVELECLCKGPTHFISLPNLKKITVENCYRLRHMFSPGLARNLLQLEELNIEDCGELEYIVSIKAEENVGGGGGNYVMLPKLRILKLSKLENFINLFDSENYSLGVQTTKKQLRGLRHGLQNLEELYIKRCRVQVLFHLEGLEQELTFPSLKELKLYDLKELECLCKGPMHLLSLSNLKKLSVYSCNRLRHMFSPSLARNFMQFEELIIEDCGELEQIFIEDDAEYNQTLLKDYLHWPLLFPSLSRVVIRRCNKLKSMFPVSIAHLLSMQNLNTLQLYHCHGLTHLFSSTTLVRNLLQLKTIDIKDCWELEQIIVEEHIEDDHVQLGLFPNLISITVTRCGKLKSLFPVSMAHLLSLQNLTTLILDDCHGLTHLFLSTLARNLLQLKSIHIWNCGELEQIIVEDHTKDDHVQLGLFPNLSSISVKRCDKLKTLFPVTIARSGLQKLSILEVVNCKELEQIIVEDHFIFPSLSSLVVKECPKITTRFSVDQNRSVHAEAEAPQTGKEDVDTEQSPLETTRDIECWRWEPDSLRKRLPPFIGK